MVDVPCGHGDAPDVKNEFTLTIRTDNAAFNGGVGAEVAGHLIKVATKLLKGSTGSFIFDENGNNVGSFDLTGRRS